MNRVVLILVDGMTPDAMIQCSNPMVKQLLESSTYTLQAQTVFPSVTLPCHMSLFHSVTPSRHGVTTNTFTPQVRPIDGLFEQLRKYDKTSAMFYSWGELKDLYQPDSPTYTCYNCGHHKDWTVASEQLTQDAIRYLKEEQPDFTFLYLGLVDDVGHQYGWLSDEYMDAVDRSFIWIQQLMETLPNDVVTFITADHGGHGRSHGTEEPADMTIPLIAHGAPYAPGKFVSDISIMDLAPTIAAQLEIPVNPYWEGKIL